MLKRKSKKPAGSDLPPTVEAATEGSAGYPGEVRVTALRERRLLMAIRGISLALIISIILNTVLAFIIVSLMPLKEIRPFLVQVAEEGTLVAAVRPIQDTFEAKDLLTEKLVREYVMNRHEILRSNSVMQSRWSPSGYLGTTTQGSEYNRFRNQVSTVIEDIRARDAQRRATITTVNTVTAGKVYLVDFISTSYDLVAHHVRDRRFQNRLDDPVRGQDAVTIDGQARIRIGDSFVVTLIHRPSLDVNILILNTGNFG